MSEKVKDFHKSLAVCTDIEAEIEEAEARVKTLKVKLAQAHSVRDTKASDAAEERDGEGYLMVPMPDGTFCGIAKAKRRKGGAEPPNKFVVKYDEKFDAQLRRIQNGEENEDR